MHPDFSSAVEPLKRIIAQIPGFRTDRKFVVIQSDDWGSLRIGTQEALKVFRCKGLYTDDPYIQYDTIASAEDLSNLFEILYAFRDSAGNNPIITANTNVANPDFEKIKESQFAHYYFERFTTTIEKLGDRGNPIQLWKEGIKKNVFRPQYHGREHLNVGFWMNALKAQHRETITAFHCNSYGLITDNPFSKKQHYLAAFDFNNKLEIQKHTEILSSGVKLFEELLGYKPASFIAPQYIWHPDHERALKNLGVHYIQGHRKQIIPQEHNGVYKKVFHYSGQQNSLHQIYLSRNCFFEPTFSGKDWIDSCLNEMHTAFTLKKPAIIGTHRLNYVSKLNNKKIKVNLYSLKRLLEHIIRKWPDALFISSDELGSIIKSG